MTISSTHDSNSSNRFPELVGQDPEATFRPLESMGPTLVPGEGAAGFIVTESSHPMSGSESGSSRLQRKFRLIEIVGTGGAGEVWSAYDTELDRIIAVKRPRTRVGSDMERPQGGMVALFQSEAHISARLDHPNIVPIYSWGLDQQRRPLLAMKLVHGTNWETHIKADRHLPLRQQLRKHLPHLITVARTVAYAHSHGIIHRDLKPQQVMLGQFGQVYLMDWGLAVRFAKETEQEPTKRDVPPVDPNCLLRIPVPAGTACYMAPEQTLKEPNGLGPWTDVFQLGGILYCLLTGSPPFAGRDQAESMGKAKRGEPLPPGRLVPHLALPQELCDLCSQAMVAKYQQRTLTATAFAGALENYLLSASQSDLVDQLMEEAGQLVTGEEDENLPSTYSRFERRAQLLKQARNLTQGSQTVESAHQVAVRELVRLSLEHGNHTVALHQANDLDSVQEREQVKASVQEAMENAARQKRQFRRAVYGLVAAFILILMVAGGYELRTNHLLLVAERDKNEQLNRSSSELKQALIRADQQTALTEATLRLTQLEQYASTIRLGSTKLQHPDQADPLLGSAMAIQPKDLRNFEWSYIEGKLIPTHAGSQDNFPPQIADVTASPRLGVAFVAHGSKLSVLRLEDLSRIHLLDMPYAISRVEVDKMATRLLLISVDGQARILPVQRDNGLVDTSKGMDLDLRNVVAGVFSPEGSDVLLVTKSGTLEQLSLTESGTSRTLAGPAQMDFKDLRFSENGRLGLVHQERLMVFEWPSGNLITQISNGQIGRSSESFFWGMDFHPTKDRLIVGHTFGTMEWGWSAEDGGTSTSSISAFGRINQALYKDSEHMMTVGDDRIMSIWSRTPENRWQVESSLVGAREQIAKVFKLDDGRLMSHDGSQVLIWSRTENTRQRILPGHDNVARRASFSPDGLWAATVSQNGNWISLWSNRDWENSDALTTETAEHTLITDMTQNMDVDWSSSGRHLAITGKSGNRAAARILTLGPDQTIQAVREIPLPDALNLGIGNSIEIAPDEQRIYGIQDKGMAWIYERWNQPDAHLTTRTFILKDPQDSYRCLRPSPNGTLVAVANWGGELHIFPSRDFATAPPIRQIKHARGINEVRWSPDGNLLAAACFDGIVYIYDTRSWNLERRLVGHRGRLRDAAFSPDGRRLVSCGSDGLFIIWDTQTAHSLLELRGTEPVAWFAEFSRRGTELLACPGDGTARIHRVQPW